MAQPGDQGGARGCWTKELAEKSSWNEERKKSAVHESIKAGPRDKKRQSQEVEIIDEHLKCLDTAKGSSYSTAKTREIWRLKRFSSQRPSIASS